MNINMYYDIILYVFLYIIHYIYLLNICLLSVKYVLGMM